MLCTLREEYLLQLDTQDQQPEILVTVGVGQVEVVEGFCYLIHRWDLNSNNLQEGEGVVSQFHNKEVVLSQLNVFREGVVVNLIDRINQLDNIREDMVVEVLVREVAVVCYCVHWWELNSNN